MFSFQYFEQPVPIEVGNDNKNAADAGNDEKSDILVVAGAASAHGKQYGPKYTPHRRNDQKMPRNHVA
jgi:hypothetical protein